MVPSAMQAEGDENVMAVCDNCKYAFKASAFASFECRRFPPEFAWDGPNARHSIGHPFRQYPVVTKEDWCGEFK